MERAMCGAVIFWVVLFLSCRLARRNQVTVWVYRGKTDPVKSDLPN